MSRLILVILAIAALVLLVLLATGVLNVNQTREARLPDVNISGGQAPVLDVDTNGAALDQAVQGAGDAVQNVNVPDVDVDVDTQNRNNQ
ncbi:MAG TPA: hypothetical protein VNT77_02210 [Allosphingosinicella sp.]|nr:hypothetical protein [Allosphingosinicella sp.]